MTGKLWPVHQHLVMTTSKQDVTAAGSSTGSATGNPRNKVVLLPGHSLMDWIRLGNSGRDLTSVGGRLRDVSSEELAKHCEQGNAWIAIRGKVYNVAPYMHFHPGGVSELMRGVGTDATDLFSEIHPWVNFESILQKCLVGRLVKSSKSPATTLDLQRAFFDSLPTDPPPKQPDSASNKESSIKMGWCQTTQRVSFTFKTGTSSPHIVVKLSPKRQLRILIKVKKRLHVYCVTLEREVDWPPLVAVDADTGRLTVDFLKVKEDCWESYGTNGADHCTVTVHQQEVDEVEAFHNARIVCILNVTHNVRTFVLKFVERVLMWVPAGHDLRIRAMVHGMDCTRQYTPVPFTLPLPHSKENIKEWPQDHVCFMVKCYENGALTPYLFSRKEQDLVEVGGPSGAFDMRDLACVSSLHMVAAGSGITPMLRLILWGLTRTSCMEMRLLLVNRCEKDIIWKDQLDALARVENTFKVTYCLSQPGPDWQGLSGRVNDVILDSFLPPPPTDTANMKTDSSRIYVCACGPTQFTDMLQRKLTERGHGSNSFCFLG